MTKSQYAPVTPGDMLKHEFIAEYGLSQNELAQAIGVSPNRITEIVNNRRRIPADTAVRLALFFGNSPEFWAVPPAQPLHGAGGKTSRCGEVFSTTVEIGQRESLRALLR